jgi:hypothetical protein
MFVPFLCGSCGGAAAASSLLRAEVEFLGEVKVASPPCSGRFPYELVEDRVGSCGLDVAWPLISELARVGDLFGGEIAARWAGFLATAGGFLDLVDCREATEAFR